MKHKKGWHRVWRGHISIQGGQTAGRYHREMVLIKNDMTCPWYTTRYPWQSIKIITNFFLEEVEGRGVSRVMSSTRDTFCGCSECELASQIWPNRQPEGVPGVSNMAPGVSPMSRYAKQEVFASVRFWVLNWKSQGRTLNIARGTTDPGYCIYNLSYLSSKIMQI